MSSDPRERPLRLPIEAFLLVSGRLYRDGISDALRRDSRFLVVGSAAPLDDAWEQRRVLAGPPDAARALRNVWPTTSIVALAVREQEEDVVSWAEAGVSGLVSRDATLAELLDAVEAASRHEVLTSPTVAAVLLRRVASLAGGPARAEGPTLTRREREIVGLIGDGLSNKEIAGSLQIELATVKNHVHNILEKLRVGRRMDAVEAARARGELSRI